MNRIDRHEEKRNFIRMRVDTPADVIIQHNESRARIRGICRDLSGGGMLIETNRLLEEGLEVKVQLASHHATSPMLRARAKIARVKANDTGNYILGMEILEMLD